MSGRRAGASAAAAAPAPARHARLRIAILRWYRARRRDLPWRRTRDPYAIWVSEIMLQQTRVETAIPYYERFLARFPTLRALARARESDVLAAWSGLGYYSRARNLRSAAAVVLREHGGALPREPEALRALPGIGPYTAAAIASVAYGRPAAAVDGNVIRVLARIAGLRGGRTAPALRLAVNRLAEALVRGESPGDWTQALMELGATVCRPRAPSCDGCPAARHCIARASGQPARYPGPARAATPRRERRVLLLARSRGRMLLVSDGDGARGAWSLPQAVVLPGAAARDSARDAARAHGLHVPSLHGPLASFRHRTFSHDLEFEVWAASPPAPRAGAPRPRTGARRWTAPEELERLPLRAPTLKALRKLQERL